MQNKQTIKQQVGKHVNKSNKRTVVFILNKSNNLFKQTTQPINTDTQDEANTPLTHRNTPNINKATQLMDLLDNNIL